MVSAIPLRFKVRQGLQYRERICSPYGRSSEVSGECGLDEENLEFLLPIYSTWTFLISKKDGRSLTTLNSYILRFHIERE